MATDFRLHIFPQRFEHLSFRDQLRTSQPVVLTPGLCQSGLVKLRRRSGFCLKQCRSFRSEEVGEAEVKEVERTNKCGNLKESETKLQRESGFWSALKTTILGGFGFVRGDEYIKALAKVEEVSSKIAIQIGRYIITMMSTGVILAIGYQMSGGDSQMEEVIWNSWLGGIVIGTMIGANMVLEEHSRAGPRNVVITGSLDNVLVLPVGYSTRGLGKALAREFLLSGDRVVVASRSPESVEMTIKELEENLKEGVTTAGEPTRKRLQRAKVVGIACNVCVPDDVQKLANFAIQELGSINIWINNAGANKGFRPLLEFSDEDLQQIVSTNLVGSLLCTREAMQIMKNQVNGGHIFNMDGAGSGGSSTPLTAAYGSTKCGLRQLQASLLKECKQSKVGVHTASPGMVLTELLLSGSSIQNKQMFNIICEHPETVARTLVPRMRVVKGTGTAINYLTPPRILLALVTAWLRRDRWFDAQGKALYAAEADRLRNWAENRTRFSFTDAMEMYTENAWLSVFSLSVVCAYIILSSAGTTVPF